ncbi:hypothetical protein Zmor_005506 [Zophobas morio]|uniref:SH3 domain-containing protein n=1 Tax=Zophobas morio TaxID=2755281 RepID=A0AA38MMI8_9CUCU|nr:hypothetical protein Zmor_005506 [Zophobas morio]
MLEQERQRIEQLTAGWDDPTQVDWGTEDSSEPEPIMRQESTPSVPLLKCTALYSYTAQNPDELTIVENEQLEVVGEGDGDGWLRARNYKGEEGYVPHNYLDVEREQTASTPGLVNQISFSSVDYTVDNEEDVQVTTSETNQSPEQVSVISLQPKVPESPPAMYCCALYDYDGEGDEELTFEEGQIIKVLSKCAHSVDDGWWKGELEGRVGNFPSLVVEECDEYGEPLTNQWDETPPQSAPPVFTPPEVPDFLMGAQVIITQPTPSVEQPQQPPPVPKTQTDVPPGEGGFSMVLSRVQHQQYGSQFEEEVPTIDVPSVEVVDEDDQSGAPPAPKSDDFSLGVAQIVITAATPMMEEPEHPFPPPEEPPVNHRDEEIDTTIPEEDEEEAAEEPSMPPPPPPPAPADDPDDADGQGGDSTPFVVSSSTGSDGETTGPSTAENSVSHVAPPPPPDAEPKQVVGGRASIPDELEPHQLARLQDLKESNA